MLKRFIRKATAAASPVNASGVAATTVSLSAPWAMNAASNKRWKEWIGGWPVTNNMTADNKNATTSEATGTTTVSHQG